MSHTKKVYTLLLTSTHVIYDFTSCDGRVVKALDLKSNGIFPRRFEPCSQRLLFYERGEQERRAMKLV